MTNERMKNLGNANKEKVSHKNLTYDENGKEIENVLIDIYKCYLLPKSRKKLDTARDEAVKLEHG